MSCASQELPELEELFYAVVLGYPRLLECEGYDEEGKMVVDVLEERVVYMFRLFWTEPEWGLPRFPLDQSDHEVDIEGETTGPQEAEEALRRDGGYIQLTRWRELEPGERGRSWYTLVTRRTA